MRTLYQQVCDRIDEFDDNANGKVFDEYDEGLNKFLISVAKLTAMDYGYALSQLSQELNKPSKKQNQNTILEYFIDKVECEYYLSESLKTESIFRAATGKKILQLIKDENQWTEDLDVLATRVGRKIIFQQYEKFVYKFFRKADERKSAKENILQLIDILEMSGMTKNEIKKLNSEFGLTKATYDKINGRNHNHEYEKAV